MINAITPLDYWLDIFIARFRSWFYSEICRPFAPLMYYEETRQVKTRDGSVDVVTCVAVISGTLLSDNLKLEKVFYGQPSVIIRRLINS